MGNPQHLKWLLEGVGAWNARREYKDFQPDFNKSDLVKVFTDSGKLDAANRSSLISANLSKADLSKAVLSDADLRGVDFKHSHLERADLRRAYLRGANLWEARLIEANLRGADLGRADLGKANLRGAKLISANIRGAYLTGANLDGANLERADVRTEFSKADADERIVRYFSDLSSTSKLTQAQLEVMRGDTGVILPAGLVHPDHWPDPAPLETDVLEEEVPRDRGEDNELLQSALPTALTARVKTLLVQNRAPLVFSGAALLEQIAAYRFEVETNNHLAAEHLEHREELLRFLDGLTESVSAILAAVPAAGHDPTDSEAEQAATWVERFAKRWKEGDAYFSPENLADTARPVGVVLGCGAFGGLLGLIGGPTGVAGGFGVGSFVGQMITKHLKPGVAADKVGELLAEDVNHTQD